MILLPTLWKTVKWKHVLFWYAAITLFFWFQYDPAFGPISIMIIAQVAMTILAVMIIMSVWHKVIYGYGEGFPILWIFSTVVKDVRIPPKGHTPLLKQMKHWCQENCEGKWSYCEHGYFVFRKKTDAMGFRLRWL